MARRATLDRKDLEFLRGMYFSPSVMAELMGGVKGRGWRKKIYRLRRLGLCTRDTREGSRAPMSWGVTQEGKQVVEMADEDWEFHLPRQHPKYRFCLARLDQVEEGETE